MIKKNDRATVVGFTQGVMDLIREKMGEPKKGLRTNNAKPLFHPQIKKISK